MIDLSAYIAVGLLGALIGSFLNVCIHRIPLEESIVWPGSHCPGCGVAIRWYDNLPLLSYLWLRGRCRACKVRISWKYPLIEATNATGYVALLWQFGAEWDMALYAVFYSALLVVTGTDLSHKIIPNVVTLPGIVVGVVGSVTVLPISLVDALVGMLMGGGLLWLLAWLSPYVFGKEGMGGGDIKLLGMVGAFLGWKPALLTIMVGSLLGSVVGISLIGLHLMKRDEYIPFGPFLAFGAVVALFFSQPILNWYQGLLLPS